MSAAPQTKLILLGTKGGPRVTAGRSNPANVVMVAGEPYVVDCGYGVTRQLIAAGIEPARVRKILITHHHSDHILELGPLIYNAWATGLREPLDVWGPPPLRQIIESFLQSMSYDIDIRVDDEGRTDLRKLVRVHEFAANGRVLENDAVRVSTVAVIHPPLPHAFAFRFDAADRSIVLSGDTAVCPALIDFAQGADVLLHEVMHLGGIEHIIARTPGAARLREHLIAAHTTTAEVGKVARDAGVGTLVLNHLVPGDAPSITDEMWRAEPSSDFGKDVIVGRDLQVV